KSNSISCPRSESTKSWQKPSRSPETARISRRNCTAAKHSTSGIRSRAICTRFAIGSNRQPASVRRRGHCRTAFRPLGDGAALIVEQHLQLEIPDGWGGAGPFRHPCLPGGVVRGLRGGAGWPEIEAAALLPVVREQEMLAQEVRVRAPARNDRSGVLQDRVPVRAGRSLEGDELDDHLQPPAGWNGDYSASTCTTPGTALMAPAICG